MFTMSSSLTDWLPFGGLYGVITFGDGGGRGATTGGNLHPCLLRLVVNASRLASLELVEVERVALVQAEMVGGVEVAGVVDGEGFLDCLMLLVGAGDELPGVVGGVGYLECLLFICLDNFSLASTMNCVVLASCIHLCCL